MVLPAWLLSHAANWEDYDQNDKGSQYYVEILRFFNDHNEDILIVEDPKCSIEEYNQCYLDVLAEIGAEFGKRFIDCDSPEAEEYYLAKAKVAASQYAMVANPFVEFAASIGL